MLPPLAKSCLRIAFRALNCSVCVAASDPVASFATAEWHHKSLPALGGISCSIMQSTTVCSLAFDPTPLFPS